MSFVVSMFLFIILLVIAEFKKQKNREYAVHKSK